MKYQSISMSKWLLITPLFETKQTLRSCVLSAIRHWNCPWSSFGCDPGPSASVIFPSALTFIIEPCDFFVGHLTSFLLFLDVLIDGSIPTTGTSQPCIVGSAPIGSSGIPTAMPLQLGFSFLKMLIGTSLFFTMKVPM